MSLLKSANVVRRDDANPMPMNSLVGGSEQTGLIYKCHLL